MSQESWKAVERAVYTASTWVLYDGCQWVGGRLTVANSVLVASPRAPVCNEWLEEATTDLWMPVWSWHELEDCRSKVYSYVSQDHLRREADISGGIPRLAFRGHRDTEEWCKALTSNVHQHMLRSVADLGTITGRDDASPRIVHWDVLGGNCRHESIQFATAWVEEPTLSGLGTPVQTDVAHVINDTGGQTGAFDDARQLVFKGWAHSILPRGGTITVRRLNGPIPRPTEDITLPRIAVPLFWDLSDLAAVASNVYARPRLRDGGAVDSFLGPSTMYHTTVAETCCINATRLLDVRAVHMGL